MPGVGRRRPAPRGFTLLEMMVVVAILGTLLLLVPANMSAFGARSRLEEAANTIVTVLGNVRGKAIEDGYEVRIQFGSWTDEDGKHEGHRIVFTNVPPPRSGEGGIDPADLEEHRRQEAEARGRERQWLYTVWHPLSSGIKLVGYSEEAKRWQKLSESEPYTISYRPDGSVQKAFALRLESMDLDVKREDRTMTVLVNGLTSAASAVDGPAELPEKRDSRDFP
jgi:prepilin-type N-terminal cleavage/methylation domain-containing protein